MFFVNLEHMKKKTKGESLEYLQLPPVVGPVWGLQFQHRRRPLGLCYNRKLIIRNDLIKGYPIVLIQSQHSCCYIRFYCIQNWWELPFLTNVAVKVVQGCRNLGYRCCFIWLQEFATRVIRIFVVGSNSRWGSFKRQNLFHWSDISPFTT